MAEPTQTPDAARREFVRAGLLGGICAACAAAGVLTLSAGATSGEAEAVAVAPMEKVLDELGPFAALSVVGGALPVEITIARRDGWRLRTRRQQVFLRRVKAGQTADCFAALSPICPHAGCSVEMAGDKKSFHCPCHDARFAADGSLAEGPSPRGLDALEVSIAARDDKPWLFIKWQDFVIGMAERKARS